MQVTEYRFGAPPRARADGHVRARAREGFVRFPTDQRSDLTDDLTAHSSGFDEITGRRNVSPCCLKTQEKGIPQHHRPNPTRSTFPSVHTGLLHAIGTHK